VARATEHVEYVVERRRVAVASVVDAVAIRVRVRSDAVQVEDGVAGVHSEQQAAAHRLKVAAAGPAHGAHVGGHSRVGHCGAIGGAAHPRLDREGAVEGPAATHTLPPKRLGYMAQLDEQTLEACGRVVPQPVSLRIGGCASNAVVGDVAEVLGEASDCCSTAGAAHSPGQACEVFGVR